MTAFSLRAVRRVAMKAGVDRISKEAMEVLRDLAEEYVFRVVQLALELAKHAGRKTVRREDVLMAAKIMGKKD